MQQRPKLEALVLRHSLTYIEDELSHKSQRARNIMWHYMDALAAPEPLKNCKWIIGTFQNRSKGDKAHVGSVVQLQTTSSRKITRILMVSPWKLKHIGTVVALKSQSVVVGIC